MLWTRNPNFLLGNKPFKKMIVHGHTPNEIVEEKSNRINLDTGAVYPELGKLSCMFIDVKKNRREFFNND
jgi:serine/threonine protein phosphatase 1